MKRLDKYILKYLLYFSPVMAISVAGLYMDQKTKDLMLGDGFLYNLWGGLIMLWCLAFVYMMFALVFSEQLKNLFVRRVARIHENDEREAQLTGTTSKKTFISSVAVLLLFLFLSVLRVHIYKASEVEIPKGNRGVISIGMGMKFFEPSSNGNNGEPVGRNYFVNYNGLPLSSDGTLILVLCVQLGLFYYFSRREFAT